MTKTFKKWKAFVNEAQQDKKFIKKFNITVLQKNTPMPPETNPREYHQQIAQQAEEGPMFPAAILNELENLDDRYFPRENRKVYTKWLANVMLNVLSTRTAGGLLANMMPYMKSNEGLPSIVDFLNGARDVPQNLWNSDWGTMRAAAEDWHEELKGVEDTGEYKTKNVVWDFGNGFTIVDIPSEDLEIEGNKMGHCVGTYCQFVETEGGKIYSLRDQNNEPHATIQVMSEEIITQIKGKENKAPIPKYATMIQSWIKNNFESYQYASQEDYLRMLSNEELKQEMKRSDFPFWENWYHFSRMSGKDDEFYSMVIDLMIADKEKIARATGPSDATWRRIHAPPFKRVITDLMLDEEFNKDHLLKLLDSIDENSTEEADVNIIGALSRAYTKRGVEEKGYPVNILISLYEKTSHYGEGGHPVYTGVLHPDIRENLLLSLASHENTPAELLEDIFNLSDEYSDRSRAHKLTIALLNGRNIPQDIVKKVLHKYVDPYKKGLTYYAEWEHPGEIQLKLQAGDIYEVLARKPGTDPKILTLIAKAASQKSDSAIDFLSSDQQEYALNKIITHSNFGVISPTAHGSREYGRAIKASKYLYKGGDSWRFGLMKNPSLPPEAAELLIKNAPAEFLMSSIGHVYTAYETKNEDVIIKILEESLKGYINSTKKIFQAGRFEYQVDPEKTEVPRGRAKIAESERKKYERAFITPLRRFEKLINIERQFEFLEKIKDAYENEEYWKMSDGRVPLWVGIRDARATLKFYHDEWIESIKEEQAT